MRSLRLLIVVGLLHGPNIVAAQRRKSEREKSSERKELLEALSSLISEAKEEKDVKKGGSTFLDIKDYEEYRKIQFSRARESRQKKKDTDEREDFGEGEDEDYDFYDDYDEERDTGVDENDRGPKQGPGFARPPQIGDKTSNNLEECETTGFETRTREECEEAVEIECNPVTVTRYRTKIVNRCKTLVDKSCNVTYTDVPKEECTPTQEQKCHTDYKLVEETLYEEECHTRVQNVCEEHIKIPVEIPYPVKAPYPTPPPPKYVTPAPLAYHPHPPTPTPHPYIHSPSPSTPTPLPYAPTPPPLLLPVTPHPHGLLLNKPAYHTTFSPSVKRQATQKPMYAYDPTPTPMPLGSTTSPLTDFIHRLDQLHRTRREASGFPTGPRDPEKLKKAIKEFLRSQSMNLTRSKKQVEPEIHHFHDHHGHPGTITKHHEFHHIPHLPHPSHGPQHHSGHHSHHTEDVHGHHPVDIHGHHPERTHGHHPEHIHDHDHHIHHPELGHVAHHLVGPHPEFPHHHIAPHPIDLHGPSEGHLGAALTEMLLGLTNHPSDAKPDDSLPRLLQQNLSSNDLPQELQNLIHPVSDPDDPATANLPLNPLAPALNPLHLLGDPLHPVPDHPHTLPPHPVPDHVHHGVDHLHPPIITTEELPAPPGCRSIATKTCHKVPHIVANKVPYETCEFVPSVKCHLVLKKVAELECVPVVEEECNDFAKEVPYLVGEEECEEVVYDDCFEVSEQSSWRRLHLYIVLWTYMSKANSTSKSFFQIEEQVPVLLCQRTRLDDKSIFLQRGQVLLYFALTAKYYFIFELVHCLNFFHSFLCRYSGKKGRKDEKRQVIFNTNNKPAQCILHGFRVSKT